MTSPVAMLIVDAEEGERVASWYREHSAHLKKD